MRQKITDFCFFTFKLTFLTNFCRESTLLTNSGKIIGGIPSPPRVSPVCCLYHLLKEDFSNSTRC